MGKNTKGGRKSRDGHSIEEYSVHSWITPPWCQVPAWSFDNRSQAENCGYASGRVVANYLSVLAVGIAVVVVATNGTGKLWMSATGCPKTKLTLR